MNKRRALLLLAVAASALAGGARGEDGLDGPPSLCVRRASSVRFGATITRRDLVPFAKTLGLQVLRIGVYWDQAQPAADVTPDFTETRAIVQAAQDAGLGVVLTVGMKAPRWPEFSIPEWALPSPDEDEVSRDATLRRRTLHFVKRAVESFKEFSAIEAWQVENEPMNRAGEHAFGPHALFFWGRDRARWIGADFVAEEVKLVRSLDARKIVVNFWSDDELVASAPWTDDDYAKRNALALADVIGLDVYPSTGGAADFSSRRVVAIPKKWLAKARAAGKEAWIVEAQAESWGDYAPDGAAVTKLLDIEIGLGYRTIFLWGLEWMERTRARDVMSAVVRFTGGEVPGSEAAAPSPTPGLVGALGQGEKR